MEKGFNYLIRKLIEVAPPSVDIAASYEDFSLRFDYMFDNLRPGSYELMLVNSDETCVWSETVSPLNSPFVASVDQAMRGCDYDVLVTWKGQVVGETAVHVSPPVAVIDTTDYKASTITVAYSVDNSRPGEYALEVLDEDHNMAMSCALNPTADRFRGAANLERGCGYIAQIRWNGILIGQAISFLCN